jgi:hypothetical protein
MVIILIVIASFIIVSVDYIVKLKNTKKREEYLLKEAIIYRKKFFRPNTVDFIW